MMPRIFFNWVFSSCSCAHDKQPIQLHNTRFLKIIHILSTSFKKDHKSDFTVNLKSLFGKTKTLNSLKGKPVYVECDSLIFNVILRLIQNAKSSKRNCLNLFRKTLNSKAIKSWTGSIDALFDSLANVILSTFTAKLKFWVTFEAKMALSAWKWPQMASNDLRWPFRFVWTLTVTVRAGSRLSKSSEMLITAEMSTITQK